jgi:hypothetical protein
VSSLHRFTKSPIRKWRANHVVAETLVNFLKKRVQSLFDLVPLFEHLVVLVVYIVDMIFHFFRNGTSTHPLKADAKLPFFRCELVRSELLLQFKKIYGVRSQIVHSGKHVLGA